MEVYEELRQHLDKHVPGAPEAPEILEILSILFTPEEAQLAIRTPLTPEPEVLVRARHLPLPYPFAPVGSPVPVFSLHNGMNRLLRQTWHVLHPLHRQQGRVGPVS